MDQQTTEAPQQEPLESRKFNPWMISTFVLAILLIGVIVYSATRLQSQTTPEQAQIPTPTPNTVTSPDDTTTSKTYTGTVKRGSEMEWAKDLCAEGFFIVADEGSYLFDQTRFLLLRKPVNAIVVNGMPTMVNNETYLNHRVNVTGLHDPSAMRCQALTCECADSIVATNITILDAEADAFTGILDCLPHRDTSGGQTLECAIGLKIDSGDYYGLHGLNDQDLASGKISVGDAVTITGTLLINKMRDPTYDTKGTIEVISIESE